jgi:hypothetical protein
MLASTASSVMAAAGCANFFQGLATGTAAHMCPTHQGGHSYGLAATCQATCTRRLCTTAMLCKTAQPCLCNPSCPHTPRSIAPALFHSAHSTYAAPHKLRHTPAHTPCNQFSSRIRIIYIQLQAAARRHGYSRNWLQAAISMRTCCEHKWRVGRVGLHTRQCCLLTAQSRLALHSCKL